MVVKSLLSILFAAALEPAAAGFDSLSFFRYAQPVRMELLLPLDGPGSAILNPARAAEASRLYGQFGTRSAGDSRATDISLGGGFAGRFFLGASLSTSAGAFDFTNAVTLDNRLGIQAAYRRALDGSGESFVALGIAGIYHYVNGMSAYKYSRFAPDFGALFVPESRPMGWRLEFGMALRDALPFEGEVPDYRNRADPRPGEVTAAFARWLGTGTLIAASPGRHWNLLGAVALGGDYDPVYWDKPLPGWDAGLGRLYLPRLGLRYRPIPFASISVERVWSSHWVLGAAIGTGEWLPFRIETDFRLAYGPYLQYQRPDKTGWSLGWNLMLGW